MNEPMRQLWSAPYQNLATRPLGQRRLMAGFALMLLLVGYFTVRWVCAAVTVAVSATYNPQPAVVGQPVIITASASASGLPHINNECEASNVRWHIVIDGDPQDGDSGSVTRTYNTPGTYQVSVTGS